MRDRPGSRIAWFTPLQPISSGISLYNEELLQVLGSCWPIDVYVDGYTPRSLAPFERLRIFPARQFKRRDGAERYATVVYQMGNSPAHAYMYDLALERPGIVVLHDTVLHHLRLSMVSRRSGAARYRDAMAREYGNEGAIAADRVLQGRLSSSLFDFPLSEEIIRAARHVVVHSAFSRNQIRSWVPHSAVSVVPMGIRLPPRIERSSARRELDLPDSAFIVASITAVNPYKRLDVVLRAIGRLRRSAPVYLLIAGSVSPHVPLDRWIGLYGLEGSVEKLGFVDDRTARLVAAASDVLVNLRYPTAGETSASLLRLMGAGRPVLVSDSGSFQELPDDAVAKVRVDVLEEETVEALLAAFHSDPDLAIGLGQNARTFVEQCHTIREMVEAYQRVLSTAAGIDLTMPNIVDVSEKIGLQASIRQARDDGVIDATGRAIAELGLGGDERLQREVARAIIDLSLLPDKM